MQKNNTGQTIIIRKKKGGGHGHHGGGWKVALADFMTAMMAFFLLMWLLETATPKELAAISGYFQGEEANKFIIGPGGADSSIIELDAPMPPKSSSEEENTGNPDEGESPGDPSDSEKEYLRQEQEKLEELRSQLIDEINNVDSGLHPLKDQIQMVLSEQGLIIQIVDKERRPMFDGGSSELHDYAMDALAALSDVIRKVPNKISIVGHTDATQYSAASYYTNWELSTDRANSARRMLLEAEYPRDRIIVVQGMADVAPLLPEKPTDPSNRRIAIIVLKKEFSDAVVRIDQSAGPEVLKALEPQEPDSAAQPDQSEKKPEGKILDLDVQQQLESLDQQAAPAPDASGWQPMDESEDSGVIEF